MIPRVSIVMPSLNGERHVQDAIGSVLAQTMTDFELIFVDNGSTDRTLSLVGAINDPRINVILQPMRGVSRARNRGIEAARGNLLAFLDSDDTWHPEFLERMCAVLERDAGTVLAYCGWQNLGLPGKRCEPFIPPDYETPSKSELLLGGCRWPIHACVTRTKVVWDAGRFNESLFIGEDYLLWLEVAARGRLVRVPEVLAYYHHHGGVQATRNHTRAVMDVLYAKQVFLGNHPDIAATLGASRVEELTWGEFLQQANALYWKGDIEATRPLYRMALLKGKGSLRDRLRMLPSLLPISAHRVIANLR
jgi:glycosyltransferase involved in cell wall biosynthesis